MAGLEDDGDDSALDSAGRGGQSLCGYEIFEELGRGASSVVFRARRPGEERDVALKVITKQTARNPAFPQRFKREIRAQASLTHPNIVGVLDYGREGGWYYLAQEYLPLGTVESLLERGGPVPGHIAACILDDVLRALSFAGARGVVHRDLKPGNLLLCEDGHIKIGDFGLARMDLDPNKSSFGTVQGTPTYMSPEQALGNDVDVRSDLFSVATILYELTSGANPYRREHGPATLMAVAQAKLLALFDDVPTVPLALDEVVARLSHGDPQKRPASADEVLPLLAPVVAEVSNRWSGVVSRYFASPESTRQQLESVLVTDEIARAKMMLAMGDEKLRPRAALHLARALCLAPSHREALALWQELASAGGFTRGPSTRPELLAVEEQLRAHPEDARLLRRGSELARVEGNVVKQAAYLRRYLRLGQTDPLAQHQLALILPDEGPAPPTVDRAPAEAAPPSRPPPTHAPPSRPPPAPAPPSGPVPKNRGPRVVGTGVDGKALPQRSRSAPAALLGALVVVVALIGGGLFFADDLMAVLAGAAEDTVAEKTSDGSVAADPFAANPIAKRQNRGLGEARAHLGAGRHDEAAAAATRAIDMDPGSRLAMEARLLRADAHLKKGDKDTAVRQYRSIVGTTSGDSYGHREALDALAAIGVPYDER